MSGPFTGITFDAVYTRHFYPGEQAVLLQTSPKIRCETPCWVFCCVTKQPNHGAIRDGKLCNAKGSVPVSTSGFSMISKAGTSRVGREERGQLCPAALASPSRGLRGRHGGSALVILCIYFASSK